MAHTADSRLDPDIASVAAMIRDPSRALMLSARADGRALLAGDLARFGRISPQSASSHLDKLFKANLLLGLPKILIDIRHVARLRFGMIRTIRHRGLKRLFEQDDP